MKRQSRQTLQPPQDLASQVAPSAAAQIAEAHQQGLIALQQGRFSEALGHLQQAIWSHPEQAELHAHLGTVHCKLGDFASGIAAYEQALTLQPDLSAAHYNLALALQKQTAWDQALQQYETLLQQQPDHIASHYQIGNIYQQQFRYLVAVTAYKQAIQRLDFALALPINQAIPVRPAAVWYNLGVAQQQLGDRQAATLAYQQALALNSNYAEAHNGLGTVLEAEDKEQALAHYQQALAVLPNHSAALINIGHLYLQQQDWQLAKAAFQQVIQQDPVQLKALDGLLAVKLITADWANWESLTQRFWTVGRQQINNDIALYQMLFLPLTAAQQQTLVQNYAQAVEHRVTELRQQLNFSFSKAHRARLRLGYLSGDLGYQAMGLLIQRLFELHDREQVEVYAYALNPDDGSRYRRQFAADSDCFRDVTQLSSLAIAEQIYADGIDILIDLEGHTQYARSEICALRPAPLIMAYLGHVGTYGAGYIDYLITDPVLASPQQSASLTEATLALPDAYLLNSEQQPVAPPQPRSAYSLPEDAFVFCGFHKMQKIGPDLFAVWMRILQQVPQGVLWLGYTNSVAQANLVAAAETAGIAGERLVFLPTLPREDYRRALQAADLFLDTIHHSAGATGVDALWAGLPLLTLAGDACAARIAASSVSAAGLPELITTSLSEYEQQAVELATNPAQLQALRQRLIANRAGCPLFNTQRTVRHLESAYQLAWANYQAGNLPRSMQVMAGDSDQAVAAKPQVAQAAQAAQTAQTAIQPVLPPALPLTLPPVPQGCCIPDVLTAEELTQITQLLTEAKFVEGHLTARSNTDIKHNMQLDQAEPVREQVTAIVIAALARHLQFQQFARPKLIRPPLFSRYESGMAYGAHIDNPLMGQTAPVCSDLSITLFLNDPASYEGGELVIESAGRDYPVKLPAGAMVVYPTTYLHRVERITSGVRLAAVTWVQSLLRRADEREIVAELEQVQQLLFEKYGRTREFALMAKTSANLLRKWAET